MIRTSGLDFGSDPAHQWDTKRELFHLAEVCAPLSVILLFAVLPSCHSMSDFSLLVEKTSLLVGPVMYLYIYLFIYLFIYVFICPEDLVTRLTSRSFDRSL